MEFEADNTPIFRTAKDIPPRGVPLHVPRNMVSSAGQWLLNAAAVVGVSVFSLIALIGVLVLGMSALEIILTWADL